MISLVQHDVRIQINRSNLSFLPEIDPYVTGYEVIAENVAADPTRYSGLSIDKPVSLHSVSVFPEEGWVDQVGVFSSATKVLSPRRIDLASIHLAKSTLNDLPTDRLIPISQSRQSLSKISEFIKSIQNRIGRAILIENISEYFSDPDSDMRSADFIREVVHATGCGVLLDISNFLVNKRNFGLEAGELQDMMDLPAIREVHIAGSSQHDGIAVDSHDSDISEEALRVLQLLKTKRTSPFATVLERDAQIPDSGTITNEIIRIQRCFAATPGDVSG